VRDFEVVRDLLRFKLPLKELEPVPKLVSKPWRVMLPPTEALFVSSKPATWVEAALKFQKPVMVWLAEREAGPLTQSSLMATSVEPEAVMLKLPGSKESEAAVV